MTFSCYFHALDTKCISFFVTYYLLLSLCYVYELNACIVCTASGMALRLLLVLFGPVRITDVSEGY